MTEAQCIFGRQARALGREDLETPAQKAGVAIPLAEFERMSQGERRASRPPF